MFIVSLKYIQPIEKIEQHLPAHIAYLDKYYTAGVFLMSGRKEPRTGGVILMKAADLNEIKRVIEEDPFYQNQLAEYDITEFKPTKAAKGLEQFKESL